MSAAGHPTREQVEATLRVASDGNGDRHDARLLAAEVRALTDTATEAENLLAAENRELHAQVRTLRAELVQLETDATELHSSGRLLGPEQCCEDGCNGGGCETCPCCCAGWCVHGHGAIPDREEDWADWLAVARVHSPVAARLAKLADSAALVARTPQPAEDGWVEAIRAEARAVRDLEAELAVRDAHQQGPRADGTWGCTCGWVQDRPHREHLADMLGEVSA
ncbi:MAG: hypothetical protein L0I76_28505 [Pseudonocardia sp.]|nr:hypothetical protein [Pseudonocardia sp.]